MLPVANQVFLGSWMVDIHQEDCSQRSAPQKRHRAHLRRCAPCIPRKPSGWDGEGNKSQPSTGEDSVRQAPGHLSCLDRGRAQNAGPFKSAPLWSTQEPEPERLRPGKCTQPRAHFRQFPCRATWNLSSVDWESTHAVNRGKPSVAQTLQAPHTHASDIFLQCSPSPQHN